MAQQEKVRIEPAVWRTIWTVLIGALAVLLDTTIVAVALHSLATDLKVPIATIQWVSTGYLLALAVAMPVTGWAQRVIGQKRVWMIALTLFLVGSILSSLAWNAGSLIGFRALQGVGGGALMPLMGTIVVQASGGKGLGRIMSIHRHPDRPRSGPRAGDRRPHPAEPRLAVAVLGQRADLHHRARPRCAVAAERRPGRTSPLRHGRFHPPRPGARGPSFRAQQRERRRRLRPRRRGLAARRRRRPRSRIRRVGRCGTRAGRCSISDCCGTGRSPRRRSSSSSPASR